MRCLGKEGTNDLDFGTVDGETGYHTFKVHLRDLAAVSEEGGGRFTAIHRNYIFI